LELEGNEWESMSPMSKDILRRMLHKNPQYRIGSKECLLHPWFYQNLDQKKKKIKSSFDIDHFQNEESDVFY